VFTIVVRFHTHLFKRTIQVPNPLENASLLDAFSDGLSDQLLFIHSEYNRNCSDRNPQGERRQWSSSSGSATRWRHAVDTHPPIATLARSAMPRRIIATVDSPKAVGPYSQAVAAGNFLFCSGQIPLIPTTGELLQGDVTEQTTQVLENLGAVLRASQMTFAHVVKTTVFLTDLGDFAAMNDVYAMFFPANQPARSTIQVAALPKGARVEIEAIAVADGLMLSPENTGSVADFDPATPL
jgi:2-iminobutanoate/2-iminopropanoate deaminase